MKNGAQRRSRSRGGRRNNTNNKSRVYDSNGPDVRIRGTAAQIVEKYATLARDANASGDIVAAQNFLQHADHYTRRLKEIRSSEKSDSLSNNLSEKDTNQDSNL